jgi:Rrf2 family protein
MKLSRSAGYGLVAAGYIAQHGNDGPVTGSRVSEECGIPMEYLVKIMLAMVRFNVLSSKRGPRGGFTLARPAGEISLLQVIEAAGGPLSHYMDLTELTKKTPLTANLENVCKEAAEKAAAVLKKASLAQMFAK